jgi:hypothetical protein
MIAQARTAYMKAATIGQKAQADAMTTRALKTLFGVADGYPELKAAE